MKKSINFAVLILFVFSLGAKIEAVGESKKAEEAKKYSATLSQALIQTENSSFKQFGPDGKPYIHGDSKYCGIGNISLTQNPNGIDVWVTNDKGEKIHIVATKEEIENDIYKNIEGSLAKFKDALENVEWTYDQKNITISDEEKAAITYSEYIGGACSRWKIDVRPDESYWREKAKIDITNTSNTILDILNRKSNYMKNYGILDK
ncbi:MAG: hypothetical protein PHX78_03525 [bacterium]|nr:hypothetical protein [bacterium]